MTLIIHLVVFPNHRKQWEKTMRPETPSFFLSLSHYVRIYEFKGCVIGHTWWNLHRQVLDSSHDNSSSEMRASANLCPRSLFVDTDGAVPHSTSCPTWAKAGDGEAGRAV